MMDQDGNTLKDLDWAAVAINGMIRGQISYVSEGGIDLPNGSKSPAFVNLIIQIPCPQNTGGRIPNFSKIYGPQPVGESHG